MRVALLGGQLPDACENLLYDIGGRFVQGKFLKKTVNIIFGQGF